MCFLNFEWHFVFVINNQRLNLSAFKYFIKKIYFIQDKTNRMVKWSFYQSVQPVRSLIKQYVSIRSKYDQSFRPSQGPSQSATTKQPSNLS